MACVRLALSPSSGSTALVCGVRRSLKKSREWRQRPLRDHGKCSWHPSGIEKRSPMSIVITRAAPFAVHSPAPTATEPALAIKRPLLWLLVVVAIGFGMRWWQITEPLQADEFGPVYATLERQNTAPLWTPAESAPLAPVASWEEVRSRSILPYGI